MTGEELSKIINIYALNKSEQDSYKKLVDRDNTIIKSAMKELGTNEFVAGDYTAKILVSSSDSFDEDKLLSYLQANNITQCIELKPVINFDILENMMYNDKIDKDVVAGMSKCQIHKEVVSLRVSKTKKKKEDAE